MLLDQGVLSQSNLVESQPVHLSHLILAHDEKYIDEVLNLTLDQKQAKRVGLPLTKEMVLRARASAGGSIEAASMALEVGISGALSSGTHHALSNGGEGFCFFNDFAIISRIYPKKNVLIIDLDVHQGNGNGEILKNDSNVTIIDLYCKNNYPLKKQCSLNGQCIGLPSAVDNEEYLKVLEEALDSTKPDFDLILFQAGVDVLKGDKFGNFNLTLEGIGQRDRMVFNYAKNSSIPISFVIGGGYSKPIEKTVEANFQTFKIAKEIYQT